MTAMASQITSLTTVYSTIYSGADQRKHQSPASLAFVRGIHRWPVNSPHKGPVTRKMFPFDDVIMFIITFGDVMAFCRHNDSLCPFQCEFYSFGKSLASGSHTQLLAQAQGSRMPWHPTRDPMLPEPTPHSSHTQPIRWWYPSYTQPRWYPKTFPYTWPISAPPPQYISIWPGISVTKDLPPIWHK